MPITSVVHHSAKVIHGNRNVLFHCALADAETCGDIVMGQAFEFVHSKDALRLGRQPGDRLEKPAQLVLFNQVLLCTRIRFRGLNGRRQRAVMLLGPFFLPAHAPARLADPVENQIVRHSEKIGPGIRYGPGRMLRHLDPKLTEQIVGIGFASGSRRKETPERRPFQFQRRDQAFLGAMTHALKSNTRF